MFKQKCSRCDKKIEKNYEYCPYCGNNLIKKEDYGLLGKSDNEEFFSDPFEGSMIDKIFKSAMTMLEKQMRNLQNETNQSRNNQNPFENNVRVQFSVNGKRVDFPNFQNNLKQKTIKAVQRPRIELTKEQAEKFAKLPKKEAKSTVRRFGNKIVYELEVPGVKNLNDILINQLESSIEIKALAPKKVYTKNLNLKLPIIRYDLNKDILTIELQAK